jgi:ubiquinone/menaquinone biosynthesis C-methylase UbiE
MLSSLDCQNVAVLNIGAGPTPDADRRLKGRVKRHVGVDPDPVILENQDLDDKHVNNGISLPFADAEFDAAYSDWTAEHVEEPLPFLHEVNRVLKPGASYWLRTNNLHHYAVVLSALTPYRFHKFIIKQNPCFGARGHDPWPTVYRMNTRRTLRRLLRNAGFDEPIIRTREADPGAYLSFHPLPFLIGVCYERFVNHFEWTAGLRFTLLVRARKSANV